jgi:hypothetical protein
MSVFCSDTVFGYQIHIFFKQCRNYPIWKLLIEGFSRFHRSDKSMIWLVFFSKIKLKRAHIQILHTNYCWNAYIIQLCKKKNIFSKNLNEKKSFQRMTWPVKASKTINRRMSNYFYFIIFVALKWKLYYYFVWCITYTK